MKQPISQFAVGDKVRNTQQLSIYYGQAGVVVETGHKGRDSLRVQYSNGSCDTQTGVKVWLEKVAD